MHEVGLVHEVVSIVTEAAQRDGLTRVTVIMLLIGEDLSVLPDSLAFAFQYLKSGMLMEEAELRWELCSGRGFSIDYIEGD